MRHEIPDQEGPLDDSWIEPLRMVERVLAQPGATVADSFFDLHDFMIMTRLVRTPRPSILLYKHRHTRHYINLDDAGHAYRYYPPPRPDSKGDGQYRRHKDLRTAVDNIGLWELPWMKEGLEHHRHGWSIEDRFTLRWQLNSPPSKGGIQTAAEFWRHQYNLCNARGNYCDTRYEDDWYTDGYDDPPGWPEEPDADWFVEPNER